MYGLSIELFQWTHIRRTDQKSYDTLVFSNNRYIEGLRSREISIHMLDFTIAYFVHLQLVVIRH